MTGHPHGAGLRVSVRHYSYGPLLKEVLMPSAPSSTLGTTLRSLMIPTSWGWTAPLGWALPPLTKGPSGSSSLDGEHASLKKTHPGIAGAHWRPWVRPGSSPPRSVLRTARPVGEGLGDDNERQRHEWWSPPRVSPTSAPRTTTSQTQRGRNEWS